MAWSCSGKTNINLIDNLAKAGLIHSPTVAAAMKKVDRANYVLESSSHYAYQDSPQPIGYGATISAPHMHAHAAEYLLPYLKPNARVLDIGSGSGYTVAIFHHIIQGNECGSVGHVVGVEHVPELTKWSLENLKRDGLETCVNSSHIKIITGDGRLGYSEAGPFNAIHVGAATPSIPTELVQQLARPGRMFIPVGSSEQNILLIDKDEDGNVSEKKLFGVSYVPLTDLEEQHRCK